MQFVLLVSVSMQFGKSPIVKILSWPFGSFGQNVRQIKAVHFSVSRYFPSRHCGKGMDQVKGRSHFVNHPWRNNPRATNNVGTLWPPSKAFPLHPLSGPAGPPWVLNNNQGRLSELKMTIIFWSRLFFLSTWRTSPILQSISSITSPYKLALLLSAKSFEANKGIWDKLSAKY